MPTTSNLPNMSFRQKSAWACLLVTLLVWGVFFLLFGWSAQSSFHWSVRVGPLIGAVVLNVVLLTAAHIFIALQSKQEPPDERDAAIAAKSLRHAYTVLLGSLGLVLFTPLLFWADPVPTVLLYAAVLLCFIAAETTRFLTQIVCYHRGFSA